MFRIATALVFSGLITAFYGLPSVAQNAPKPAGSETKPAPQVAPVPATSPEDTALAALVGKAAPSFSLPDQNDLVVSLEKNRGKWIVLAFYPADMTTGCTFQNRSYSQNLDKFAPLGATVFTVSTQNTASKRDFCSKEGLKHTLLSDVGGRVSTAYGVLRGEVARRVTFYIDPQGRIAAYDAKPNVAKAAEDSLAKLKELQAAKPVANTAPTTEVEESDGTFDTIPIVIEARVKSKPSFNPTDEALATRWRGVVQVKVTVNADGTHTEQIIKGSGYKAMDDYILQYFADWKWTPATRNGTPIKSEKLTRFRVE